MVQRLRRAHEERFGRSPEVAAFAPGRVNFIGEHTDYNGGLTMPLALQLGIYAAASRNPSGRLRLLSLDFKDFAEVDFTSGAGTAPAWTACPRGMAALLNREKGGIGGADLTLTGNLPVGAGLSSSAAAEVAVGTALAALFGIKCEGISLALLAQKAEHEFTGTQCGIMDQAISVLGKQDRLLRLNCRDLSYDHAPFAITGLKLWVINSGVKHNLADGEYNRRRSECAEALSVARKVRPGLPDLSAFPLADLQEHRTAFAATSFRRARHVLSENLRVNHAARALEKGDFSAVGRLMNESHASLKNDYEVTCPETDFLAGRLSGLPGVLGARMTGGGFGGSVIALANEESEPAIRTLLKQYEAAFQATATLFEAQASEGARLLFLP